MSHTLPHSLPASQSILGNPVSSIPLCLSPLPHLLVPPAYGAEGRRGCCGSALMSSSDQIPLDLCTNCGSPWAEGAHSSSPQRPWKPKAECEISPSCLREKKNYLGIQESFLHSTMVFPQFFVFLFASPLSDQPASAEGLALI